MRCEIAVEVAVAVAVASPHDGEGIVNINFPPTPQLWNAFKNDVSVWNVALLNVM